LIGFTLGYQVNDNMGLEFGYKSSITDDGPNDLRADNFMVSIGLWLAQSCGGPAAVAERELITPPTKIHYLRVRLAPDSRRRKTADGIERSKKW
jgi:hypothetical protein